MLVNINNWLEYKLYFAETYTEKAFAIMEVRDKVTKEKVATVSKQTVKPVSVNEQTRKAQLLKEFKLLSELLTPEDYNNIAKYEDAEWVLTHRVMYVLTQEKLQELEEELN
jgi:hypothetical protein